MSEISNHSNNEQSKGPSKGPGKGLAHLGNDVVLERRDIMLGTKRGVFRWRGQEIPYYDSDLHLVGRVALGISTLVFGFFTLRSDITAADLHKAESKVVAVKEKVAKITAENQHLSHSLKQETNAVVQTQHTAQDYQSMLHTAENQASGLSSQLQVSRNTNILLSQDAAEARLVDRGIYATKVAYNNGTYNVTFDNPSSCAVGKTFEIINATSTNPSALPEIEVINSANQHIGVINNLQTENPYIIRTNSIVNNNYFRSNC